MDGHFLEGPIDEEAALLHSEFHTVSDVTLVRCTAISPPSHDLVCPHWTCSYIPADFFVLPCIFLGFFFTLFTLVRPLSAELSGT